MAECKPNFVRVELNKTIWETPKRYTQLAPLGSGAYGQVCSAYDTHTNTKVAIKKLTRPFQSAIHAKRTYREERMLKHMDHENIIGLLDVFTPTSSLADFEEVYLVTHYMPTDLYQTCKRHKLDHTKICLLTYQLLRGLKYVHSANIVHRDLKPSNIAVNDDYELKILDFGLARHTDDEMTGYVVTRWYRAPEIMLNWMHYNQAVDVWSVGCILAELLTGKPLFPGTDPLDHLQKIMRLIGKPEPALMAKLTSEDARRYIDSFPTMPARDLKDIIPGANPQAIDLLERMLDFDPDKRITAEEALGHPYLKQYANPADEPTSDAYDDSFENKEMDIEEWRKLVFQDVLNFHPHQEPMTK